MTLANQAQIFLLIFYAILTILFFKQNQWPVALYYLGCIIKDTGVFVLAYFEKH